MKTSRLWKLWTSQRVQGRAGPGALLLALLLGAGDLLVPLGYAYGTLNSIPILLAFFSRQRRWVLAVTLTGIATTTLAPLFSEPAPGVAWSLILFNRIASVAVCLLAGLVTVQVLQMITHIRNANHDLQQSGALLEIASHIGKLGGWQLDLDTQAVHWSDEVARIHGHPGGHVPRLDEALGYYLPEGRAPLQQAIDLCAREGRDFDLRLQIATIDGQHRWVRVVGQALRNDQGRIIRLHGAFQDIDAEMRVHRELAGSAERWHALAEAMPLIVWTADDEGHADFFSGQLATYLQVPLQELMDDGWLMYLHPDDVPDVAALWSSHQRSRTPYEAEFRIRRHDGRYEWHLARANFMQGADQRGKWYGSAMNIDALKSLQQQAAELAQRLSATMESVTDAIYTLDIDWRFSYLNHHAETLLRRHRDALLGKLVWDEFPETRNSIFEEQYRRSMQEQVAVRFEAWFAPLETLFEINAYPSPQGLSVYFRDITEHRRLSEQMQQVRKLEALGQLTGGVAHDFNNLLTVIMGNAESLQEQLVSQPRLERLANMITSAAHRAADMTQRLLAFARKQALEPVAADLNSLLTGLEPLLQRTLGANIDIELILAEPLWTTLVDPGQLENCVLNLAINSRDAMPQGGTLTLETANVSLDASYVAAYPDLQPGQYVLLAVSDTGTGIAPELLKKVFEPFFTTKDSGKGTGLGLAMVYGFVKQSNGHISVYSEQGNGATIKIYLPRLLQTPDVLPEPADAEPVATGNGELILLVEDDALVQQYTQVLLLDLGYRVLSAGNAGDALQLLQQHPDIDLLFTDIMMPGGMNGDALAEEARRSRPTLPVLFTTGYSENALIRHGRLQPGVLLLGKPYRRSELADKIRRALAQRD